jgi:hypothetical protein
LATKDCGKDRQTLQQRSTNIAAKFEKDCGKVWKRLRQRFPNQAFSLREKEIKVNERSDLENKLTCRGEKKIKNRFMRIL